MPLITCPECGGEISDSAKVCPSCGCNVKQLLKKQAQERKLIEQQEQMKRDEEVWKNSSPLVKVISIAVLVVILGAIVFIFVSYFGTGSCTPGGIDHHDGKCDICKSSAYSSINGEEFCYEHYKSAIDYYLDD